jgi:hypothetical protein
MPDLPADIREAVLWRIQDLVKRLADIEELLCLSEEEEENGT